LDPDALALTPQKWLLCCVPSLRTGASSLSPAFEEGWKDRLGVKVVCRINNAQDWAQDYADDITIPYLY